MFNTLEKIINEEWKKSNKSFDKDRLTLRIEKLFSEKRNINLQKIHNPLELCIFLSKQYKIPMKALKGKRRFRKIVKVRQIYCYLASIFWTRKEYNLTEIGLIINYTQSNTIQKAINTIEGELEYNKKFKKDLEKIKNQIYILK